MRASLMRWLYSRRPPQSFVPQVPVSRISRRVEIDVSIDGHVAWFRLSNCVTISIIDVLVAFGLIVVSFAFKSFIIS
jgi:hypothetical protein